MITILAPTIAAVVAITHTRTFQARHANIIGTNWTVENFANPPAAMVAPSLVSSF
ncbi:MAG: hypothetical protein SFV54_02135 [Bryobacteraceae bacterium]|nr:hypothetical protein [Bryobacteraceae bacterium]